MADHSVGGTAVERSISLINGTDNCLIGVSDALKRIRVLVNKIAPTDATVLITGETGTGKEVVARLIHHESHRRAGPFVALNCSAIADGLQESELFGHKRGGHSQATEDRDGVVAVADGGTLFLDEIDSLKLETQPKLLRLIQEHEYRRVGDSLARRCNVRFVAASASDLGDLIERGEFRADLYYRLALFELSVPPLRDHKDDIPALCEFFISKFGPEYGSTITKMAPEALAVLRNHNWPGNVRELENCIHRALIGTTGQTLLPEHIRLTRVKGQPEARDWNRPYHELKQSFSDQFQKEYIEYILQSHCGNISAAAKTARIDRRTLQRWLAKHNIKKSG